MKVKDQKVQCPVEIAAQSVFAICLRDGAFDVVTIDRLGRSLQDLRLPLRAAQPRHRLVPTSARHRHNDASR
jgi:hypothetical protein